MNSMVAIAFNTFKEAVRNRILYIILLFALIMIGTLGAVSELTVTAHEKIIKDLGFMAINLFGIAISIFVGVSLVYNELDKKTIYTIVSKPIARWQFLLGKFFGLLLTIYVNLLIMTFFFLFMLHFQSMIVEPEKKWLAVAGTSIVRAFVSLVAWNAYPATMNVMGVIMATVIEIMMVTAFAILYSSFSTPTLSMFFTVLTFLAGRLNEDIVLFASSVKTQAVEAAMDVPMSYYMARISAAITPNLEIFHRTVEQALYEKSIHLPQYSIPYAFLYTAAVLWLATWIFGRRNFK